MSDGCVNLRFEVWKSSKGFRANLAHLDFYTKVLFRRDSWFLPEKQTSRKVGKLSASVSISGLLGLKRPLSLAKQGKERFEFLQTLDFSELLFSGM